MGDNSVAADRRRPGESHFGAYPVMSHEGEVGQAPDQAIEVGREDAGHPAATQIYGISSNGPSFVGAAQSVHKS